MLSSLPLAHSARDAGRGVRALPRARRPRQHGDPMSVLQEVRGPGMVAPRVSEGPPRPAGRPGHHEVRARPPRACGGARVDMVIVRMAHAGHHPHQVPALRQAVSHKILVRGVVRPRVLVLVPESPLRAVHHRVHPAVHGRCVLHRGLVGAFVGPTGTAAPRPAASCLTNPSTAPLQKELDDAPFLRVLVGGLGVVTLVLVVLTVRKVYMRWCVACATLGRGRGASTLERTSCCACRRKTATSKPVLADSV